MSSVLQIRYLNLKMSTMALPICDEHPSKMAVMFFLDVNSTKAAKTLEKCWIFADKLRAENKHKRSTKLSNSNAIEGNSSYAELNEVFFRFIHLSHLSCLDFHRKERRSGSKPVMEHILRSGSRCSGQLCSSSISVGVNAPACWKPDASQPLKFGQLFKDRGEEVCLFVSAKHNHPSILDMLTP